MTKASIQQFSTTNTSNTDVAGINVNTGWPPSNVGPAFRELMALLASAMVPLVLNIAGETSLTLTAAQASAQLIQFTGALTGNCTVTIPNAVFVGIAQNLTTGAFNVILTAGVGTTATIPPGASLNWYGADGATNVTLSSMASGPGTSGNEVVNFSQFSPDVTNSGFSKLPGGLIFQWGTGTDPTGGVAVAFPTPFINTVFSLTVGMLTGPGVGVYWAPAGLNSFNAHVFNTENGTALSGSFTWLAIGS